MAKPVGVGRALKDNSNKHPQQHEEWMKGKKIGRKKQVWVRTISEAVDGITGHWEKE